MQTTEGDDDHVTPGRKGSRVNQIDGLIGEGPNKAIELIKMAKIRQEQDLNLEMQDLQNLNFIKAWTWEELRNLNISKNNICNIDIVCQYDQLLELDASYNFIEEVNLYLPNLRKLNLQYNKLNKFPILEKMHKLKDLNLNSNCLTSFKDVIIDFTPNIEKLDIGQNNLSFKIESDFMEFIEKLKDLNQLTHLDVLGNTFFQKENLKKFKGLDVKEEIIEQLKNLQVFNGDDIETVKININKQREEDKIKKKNVKVKPPPKLEDLLYHLESANSHPSFALDHLKDLAQDVDSLIQKIDLIQKYFAPDKDDIEVRENLETFMQNTLILMDIHQEHQETILSMLAKLTIVKFQDFGLMCFNTLKDLMDSGKTMEKQVTEVLKKQVIKQMKQQDPLSIPASLFMGLNEIIQSTGNNSLVTGLYDSCFSKWLKKFCELLRETFKNTGMLMGDHEHYDSILSLLAVSIEDDDEQKQNIINQNLTAYISEIFQQSMWEHDRYIPCLSLIATLSNYGTGAEDVDSSDENIINPADQFMESLVHQNLLNQIKKSMVVYKKNNSLFDEHSKETIEQQQLRYQTLASEIETLGGLLQASAENRLMILEEPVVLDLISIMSHKKTDPILLKSICTFALDLFECPELKDDQDRMEPFHKEMADMKMMVPYLGMARYPDLLAMTSRYHSSQNKGYETPGQQDNAQQQEEGTENTANTLTSLKHLDDPIVNELFISIINLMRFFCLEAEQNDKNKLFDAISYSLNKNRREEGLFNCLGVPDDDVRLAVVKCLYVVPLDELERDEIDQVTAIMTNCSNIAAGKTELVLSVIYQICCKFVQIDLNLPDCPPSCRIFQEQFGEKTMNEALTILNRNLQRTVHADDDWDKYALSVSILNFIKSSTLAPLMQRYMVGKDEIFQEILMNEDYHSSDRVKRLPIDLESSIIGMRIECLLNTLQKALNPYCDVSLRVIMRIADILMNRLTCKDYKLEVSEQGGLIQKLMDHQEQYFRKKTSQERDYWVDMPQNFFRVLEKAESDNLKDSHYNFTQGHGQEILIEFLTSQFVQNEEYTVFMSDEKINQVFDIQHKQFKDEIDEFNQNLEDKYKKKYVLDENKKFDPYRLRKTMLQKQSGLNEDDCHDCNKGNLHGFDTIVLDLVGNYCKTCHEKDDKYIFIADISGEAHRQFREQKYEIKDFFYEIKQLARKKMTLEELRQSLVSSFIQCIKSGKQLVLNLEERQPNWDKYDDPQECPLTDVMFHKQTLKTDFKKICKNDELKQFNPQFNLIIIANVSDPDISDDNIKEFLETIPNFNQFKKVYIESDDDYESPDMRNTSNTHSQESRNQMQYEKIGIDIQQQCQNKENSEMTQGEKLIKLNEQHAENLKKSNDAHRKKFKLKQQRGDGFLNNQLRSITVAALLRCLYGSIEYAPTVELRNSAINNIKEPKNFKRITQLCDSTDWDENCNIGAKYLRVMRSVIKLPHCKGVGYSGFLMHYKLIAIVIQKTLKKIIDKMNKDIELNHGDQVANYEISLTFFQIVQSANNFIFSTEDILKLHLENEIKLKRMTQMNNFVLTPEDKANFKKQLQDVMTENLNEDNPMRKCQYEDAQMTDNYENFKVQLPDLRHKRTIQQKVVEKMVLSLFSQESIFTLVDILFKDMKEDYKTIENTKFKTDSDHDDSDHSHHGGLNQNIMDDLDQDDEDSEEDSEDETKYGKDIDEYMGIKGVLTIERIKDVVGEIMNSCAKKMKYEILEKIMKGVIFEKKKVRQSFMQEILNAADNSSYRNALEKYIKYNRFSVANYFNDQPKIGDTMYDEEFCECNLHPSKINIERIMELSQVDLNNKFLNFNTMKMNNLPSVVTMKPKFFKDDSFAKRLFVLTTQGIQIMKEPDSSIMCKDCPPQSFCPIGPVQDVCIRYEQIESVISFVQIPQKLVIIYLTDFINEKGQIEKESECKFQLTLNIPTYTKCSKIYTNLLSILWCIKTQKSQMKNAPAIQTFGSFSDKLFQVDLRMFIKQINPSMDREAINFSSLTYAQLLQIDIITEKYKKDLLKPVQNTKHKDQKVVRISMNQVDDKMKAFTERQTPTGTDDGSGGAGSYFGFAKKVQTVEKDMVIKDAVLICVIDGKMLLIKEQWHNWESLHEKSDYEQDKLQKLIQEQYLLRNFTPGGQEMTLITEDDFEDIQNKMGEISSKIQTKLFKLMAFVQVEHIKHVYVNRGKDPTIEIVCFNDEKLGKCRTIKIKFPGDMERQRFVDQIIEEWEGLTNSDKVDGSGEPVCRQELVVEVDDNNQEKKKGVTARSEVVEDDEGEEEDIDCTIYD